ncbi:hypothetical protein GQ53DRAFT_840834 [Thozetella sp. PMI_491]|nr:hypothetical protein GQ53DRAFT_840834 [Thozetella sp. PMI_491]
MERPRPVVSIAKWGAACGPCAASKSKCIRSNTQSGARCDRKPPVGPTCVENVSSLLRPPPDGRTSIPSPLSSSSDHSGGDRAHSLDPAPSYDRAPSLEQASPELRAAHMSVAAQRAHRLRYDFHSGTPVTCVGQPPYREEDARPPDSDEALLSMYMNQLCPIFPFVIIPPGTTPAQLESRRPFLWKAIKLVSSIRILRSLCTQNFFAMDYLSEAIFIRSERSLDLVEGMLVITAYYQYMCIFHSQFTNLVRLATGMLADMGMNRAAVFNEKRYSNQERRVILGVWYITSHASMSWSNRVEPMRYTKHIDQCLRELQQSAEYETDALAVEIVRIQHLAGRIYRAYSQSDDMDDLPGVPTIHLDSYSTAFKAELARLQASLPEKLRYNYFLLSHYDLVRLQLYEPALGDKTGSGQSTPGLDTSNMPSAPGRPDLEELRHLCHALKATFTHVLSIPVCSYFYFPQTSFAMILHSIMIICRWVKLSTTKDPELGQFFSLPEVQIDAAGLLEQLADRFETSTREMRAAFGVWDNPKLEHAASKVRFARSRLKRMGEIVVVAGSEALLLDKYVGLASNLAADETAGPAVGAESSEVAIAEGPGTDLQYHPGPLYGMELDLDFFLDVLGDWDMSFATPETESVGNMYGP